MPKAFKEKRQRLELRTPEPPHVIVPRPQVVRPVALADLSTPRTTSVGPFADGPRSMRQGHIELAQVHGPAPSVPTDTPMVIDGVSAPVGPSRSSGIKAVCTRMISALQPHTWSWRRSRRESTCAASTSAVTVEQMDALADATNQVRMSDNQSVRTGAPGPFRVTVETVPSDEEMPEIEWDASAAHEAEWDPALDVDIRISREEAHLVSLYTAVRHAALTRYVAFEKDGVLPQGAGIQRTTIYGPTRDPSGEPGLVPEVFGVSQVKAHRLANTVSMCGLSPSPVQLCRLCVGSPRRTSFRSYMDVECPAGVLAEEDTGRPRLPVAYRTPWRTMRL